MKKFIFVSIIFLLLFGSFASAASPFNFLTRAFADTLYCHFDGTNCNITIVNNLTIIINQGKEGSPPYLFNNSNTMFFNESTLNRTVKLLSINESELLTILDNSTIIRVGNTTWLNENIIDLWVNITGDTMTGQLNINNNLNVTGNTTFDGFLHLGNLNQIPISRELLKDSGDLVIGGSTLALNGLNILVEPFGQGLTVNDDNESAVLIRLVNGTGQFEGEPHLFCDNTTGFTLADVTKRLSFVGTEPEITAPIRALINSSCVILTIAAPNPPAFSNITYIVSEPGIFTVYDGGHSVFILSEDEDSSFEIIANNATSIAPIFFSIKNQDVGVRSLFINTDVNGFGGNAGFVSLLRSSKPVINAITSNMVLASQGPFQGGLFNSLVINLRPGFNDTETTAIAISPHDVLIRVRNTVFPVSVIFENSSSTTIIPQLADPRNLDEVESENGSTLYIGNFINFTQINFAFNPGASESIAPVFRFCNGTTYEIFNVTDNTDGFQNTGVIQFINPSTRGSCNFAINGSSFVNDTNFTYISITRTNSNPLTAPVLETLQITETDLIIKFGNNGENMVGAENSLGTISEVEQSAGQSTFYWNGLSAGNQEVLFGLQNGLFNGSASFLRNSFYIGSTVGYGATNERENMTFLQSPRLRWDRENITTFFDYDSLTQGSVLGVQHGIETKNLRFHDSFRGEGMFNVLLEGNDASFADGPVRDLIAVNFTEGVAENETANVFQETFAVGLGSFSNLQTNQGNWISTAGGNCNSGDCAVATCADETVCDVSMAATFSTSNFDRCNITFGYTFLKDGGFDATVNLDNGPTDSDIFSQTVGSSEFNQEATIDFTSDFENESSVTITVNIDGDKEKPLDQFFFDLPTITCMAIESTEVNVSSFDGVFCASPLVDANGDCLKRIEFSAEGNNWTAFPGGQIGAAGGGGTTDHSALTNLEMASSGHTFAASGQVLDIGSYNLTTVGSMDLNGVDVCLENGTDCAVSNGGNSSSWNRSGTNVFLANQNDSVGIGTSSPDYTLTIENNKTDMIKFKRNEAADNSAFFMDFNFDNSVGADTTYIRFHALTKDVTDGTEDASLLINTMQGGVLAETIRLQNGDLGIGVTPSQKIHMKDASPAIRFTDSTNNRFGDIEYEGSTALQRFKFEPNNAGFPAMFIQSEDIIGVGGFADLLFLGNHNNVNGSNMVFESFQGDTFYIQTRDANSGEGDIIFRTDAPTTGEGNERMIITSTGLVGIGTVTPEELLHIFGVRPNIKLEDTTSNPIEIEAFSVRSGANQNIFNLRGFWNNTEIASIALRTGDDTVNKDDGEIAFSVGDSGSLSEAMRIHQSGNVGIGTTIPNELLHINSATNTEITIETTSPTNDAVLSFTSGNAEWKIFNDGSDEGKLKFRDVPNATTVLTITSEGNVGIGTTIPSKNLDVVGTTAPFRVTGDSAVFTQLDKGWKLETTSTGATTQLDVIDQDTASDRAVAHFTSNAGVREVAWFGADGKVGFGTDSPSAELFVHSGSIGLNRSSADGIHSYFGGAKRAGLAFGSSNEIRFFTATNVLAGLWDGDGNLGIGTTSPLSLFHVDFDSSAASNQTVLSSSIFIQSSGIKDAVNYGGGIIFGQPNGGVVENRGSSIFVVEEGTTTEVGLAFSTHASGAGDPRVERMRIDSDGNVGIGTTTPSQLLEVSGTVPRIVLVDPATNGFPILQIADGDQVWAVRGISNDLQVRDNTLGVDYLTFEAGTNASGFGTSNPNYKLEIEGIAQSGFFAVSNNSDGDIFEIDVNGNIGIGTATPSSTLDVVGTSTFDIATTTDQVEIQRGNSVGAVDEFVLSILDTSNPDVGMSWQLLGITNDPLARWTLEDDSAGGNLEYYLNVKNSAGTTHNDVILVDNDGDISFSGTVTGGNQIFAGYMNTNSVTFTTGIVNISIDVEDRKDSFYSHSTSVNPQEITVLQTGDYKFEFDSTVDVSIGVARSDSQCWIEVNDVKVDGTEAVMYNRLAGRGETTAHTSKLLSLTANDVLLVACQKLTATTDTLIMNADRSRIYIEWVE